MPVRKQRRPTHHAGEGQFRLSFEEIARPTKTGVWSGKNRSEHKHESKTVEPSAESSHFSCRNLLGPKLGLVFVGYPTVHELL